jgi:ribosomal protein L29
MKSSELLKELNKKSIKQLNESLSKNRDKLHELRRDMSLGKLKNYRDIRATRKEIAQTITILNNKAFEIATEESQETSKETSND